MTTIDSLIDSNKGLVYAQLHKFNLINDPDAESIAFEALLKAVKTYDASKNIQLSTYATVIIYNALGSYVRTLNSKRKVQVISYNNIAFTDEHGKHEFHETIACEADTEGSYIKSEQLRHTREVFNTVYARLTNDKHKRIVGMWNESDFTISTTTIASTIGVSQSYVSQVINNFKHSLRKELEDIYYD